MYQGKTKEQQRKTYLFFVFTVVRMQNITRSSDVLCRGANNQKVEEEAWI